MRTETVQQKDLMKNLLERNEEGREAEIGLDSFKTKF